MSRRILDAIWRRLQGNPPHATDGARVQTVLADDRRFITRADIDAEKARCRAARETSSLHEA